MRLQVMSDLHLDQWTTEDHKRFVEETQTDADALVLAGDIVSLKPQSWRKSVDRLTEFGVRYKYVIYVPGNHEYWGTRIDDVLADSRKLEQEVPGLVFLDPCDFREVLGKRFYGATMFQPAPVTENERLAWYEFADRRMIKDFRYEAPHHFRDFKDTLEAYLNPGDIVVTHHAPSNGSLDPLWAGNRFNRWFITPEMEPLILKRKPALWIHGHVHTPFDYRLGETRVICNPRGYPGEGVKFNPKLIVEV